MAKNTNNDDPELKALRDSFTLLSAETEAAKKPIRGTTNNKPVKKVVATYDEKILSAALENCRQLDESVVDKISEAGLKSLIACQKKSYDDLLLNPFSLDFSWQKKPLVKQLDTVYTFEDVIGRPACVTDRYPFPELGETDIKTPSNRAAHSIYIRPDTNLREYSEVMLNCKKDAKGLSPEEYLKEQEAIISNLKMIIEDLMRDSVMAIDYKKGKLRMENPKTQAKADGQGNPEDIQQKEYKAALDEYKKRLSIRNEALEAFGSSSNLYFTAYKRKKEIIPEMERLNDDIISLQKSVKGGFALKTLSLGELKNFILGKAKSFFTTVPTNEELLESSKVALKEYQSELDDLNKEMDEYKIDVRTGLKTIPLDTKLDVELLKAIYDLNKEAFLLPEIETKGSVQEGGSSPAKKAVKRPTVAEHVLKKEAAVNPKENGAKARAQKLAAARATVPVTAPVTAHNETLVEGKDETLVEKKPEPLGAPALKAAKRSTVGEHVLRKEAGVNPKENGPKARVVSSKRKETGKQEQGVPAVIETMPIPYELLRLKPLPSRALLEEEIDALKDLSDEKYSIYEATFLENESYGVEKVNKFIEEVNTTFDNFKRVTLNKIILQDLETMITEKEVKIAFAKKGMEATFLETELKMLVDQKMEMEKLVDAGKNVTSANEEIHQYTLSSLLRVPENMILEDLDEGEESVLKGASIENKLAVPDMQGFLKLVTMK
jgi:hypothetical protein